jgi:hypothetical protein
MGHFREDGEVMKKVKCPFCGYEMPIFYDKDSVANGIKTRCKGRNCKKEFEIKIMNNMQIK